jgi:hypothetical protein
MHTIARTLTRRPRPLALLILGLALAVAALIPVTTVYHGRNAGITVGPAACSVGWEWHGDPGPFSPCTGHDPDAAPAAAASVRDFNDGFTDGRSDATGDNNRNGRIEPGELGWSCRATPLTDLDKCLALAGHPAYSWQTPDGSTSTEPDGRTALADLDARPGTTEYTAALTALTAQWTAAHR